MLSEWYSPDGNRYGLTWVPGVFVLFFALLGLVPTFLIPRLSREARTPGGLESFATYLPSLRQMAARADPRSPWPGRASGWWG